MSGAFAFLGVIFIAAVVGYFGTIGVLLALSTKATLDRVSGNKKPPIQTTGYENSYPDEIPLEELVTLKERVCTRLIPEEDYE